MKKLILIVSLTIGATFCFAQNRKTKNLIIVTLDGMRWQEVFKGAYSAIINSRYTEDKDEVRKKYWNPDASERRKMLFPFLWNTLAKQGQIYGNRDLGNKEQLSNPYRFSYPGYNEIFTGFPDARMNNNDAVANPNMNLLEFLNRQKGFEGKVITFSSWERFPQF